MYSIYDQNINYLTKLCSDLNLQQVCKKDPEKFAHLVLHKHGIYSSSNCSSFLRKLILILDKPLEFVYFQKLENLLYIVNLAKENLSPDDFNDFVRVLKHARPKKY